MSKTSIDDNRIKITLPGLGTLDVRGNGAFVARIWGLVGTNLSPDIDKALGDGRISLVIDEALSLMDTDEDVDEEEEEQAEEVTA